MRNVHSHAEGTMNFSLQQLEKEVEDYISYLEMANKNGSVNFLVNAPDIEDEMCKAILKVIGHLKIQKSVFIGRGGQKSKQNLSWVLAKEINPVLEKLFIGSTALSECEPAKLNEKSQQKDFIDCSRWVSKAPVNGESEKKALYFLSNALETFAAHYCIPIKKKSVAKSIEKLRNNGSEFCTYCYREKEPGTNICRVHSKVYRTYGKRYHERFLKMLQKIHDFENDPQNLLDYQDFGLVQLEKLNLGKWAQAKSKRDWVKSVLSRLDICASSKINDLSDRLLKISKDDHLQTYPNWPSSLNQTMFRYQAFMFSQLPRPSQKVAERLNLHWQGKSIKEVQREKGGLHSAIRCASKRWKLAVEEYRNEKIPDALIKAILGIQHLP